MFELDLINGLPAHPLLVHAPVVLVPLTSLLLIALVFFPKLQKNYLKLAVVGAVVSLVVSKLAESSGEELSERVGLPVEHSQAGERLVQVTVLLLVVTVVWTFLIRKNSKPGLIKVTGYALSLIAIGAMFVTYQAGHSGAKATWEKRITQDEQPSVTTPTTEGTQAATGITLEELALHNTAQDCWSTVNGKVYDLTEFVSQHPGGSDKIEQICGRDGTSAFNGEHRGDDTAISTLGNLLIGDLAN